MKTRIIALLIVIGLFCLMLITDNTLYAQSNDDNPKSTDTQEKPEVNSDNDANKDAVKTVQDMNTTGNEGPKTEDPNKEQPSESDKNESGKVSPAILNYNTYINDKKDINI